MSGACGNGDVCPMKGEAPFYALAPVDQAKRGTKAPAHRASAAFGPDERRKKVFVSGIAQDFHDGSTGFPQCRSVKLVGKAMKRLVLAMLVVLACAPGLVADDRSATILRVFLKDGTAIASFGEYARIDDRVVFSMLLGSGSPPQLQLVNLPASAIDWASTSRYADAARYAQYVATRAEADYAALTNEVAKALNRIALASDTSAKLDAATRVRRLLGEWPAWHYAYRSADIHEMTGLLDEAISELKASAGERQFALSLVAAVEPPATTVLLPPPSAAETIEQALAVARTSDVPAERLFLYQTIASLVDDAAASLPRAWTTWARESVRQALEIETKIEREYVQLMRRLLGLAETRAARADVRGLEAVVRNARRADAKLGNKRPGQMAALMAELDRKLDEARRLRLARDQWRLRIDQYRAYQRETAPLVEQLDRDRGDLEQIRSLAGPDVNVLAALLRRLQGGLARAASIRPPGDLQGLHATLVSALQLGASAARLRQAAAASANLPQAWDASSAAAGSLMLAGTARAELERVLRPPQLP